MATERRVFLAHPKSLPQDATDDYAGLVKTALEGMKLKDGSTPDVKLQTGRETVQAFTNGRKGLDWRAWEAHVLGRLGGPFDRNAEPRFHYMVVVPSVYVGKATAEMIERALRQPWPKVLYFDESSRIRRVAGINVLDARNFQQGWALLLEGT